MFTLVQKTSQVLLHMGVAFAVTYGFTGSIAVGGLAAIVEPICNVLILPLHDRAWARIRSAWPTMRARRSVACLPQHQPQQ